MGVQLPFDAMSAQQFQFSIDGQYTGGVDSLLYPTDLAPGTYAWGVNVINRGGVVQTRPGQTTGSKFPRTQRSRRILGPDDGRSELQTDRHRWQGLLGSVPVHQLEAGRGSFVSQ